MKNSPWTRLATILPGLILNAIQVVEHIKGAQDKQKAVLETIPAMVQMTEVAVNKDLLNDPEVMVAAKAFIDAKVALSNVLTRKQAEAAAAK